MPVRVIVLAGKIEMAIGEGFTRFFSAKRPIQDCYRHCSAYLHKAILFKAAVMPMRLLQDNDDTWSRLMQAVLQISLLVRAL